MNSKEGNKSREIVDHERFKCEFIKNKGTPNLLNSSDNIDGTQTFLTQLSAVKLDSIEKRGKIQTTASD